MARTFSGALRGAQFKTLERRGKFLIFEVQPRGHGRPRILVGHLGMTGRMYLLPRDKVLPKHAAVVFDLGKKQFVFEDTRYFGRLTLDDTVIEHLGPEPLSEGFTVDAFAKALKRSTQPIKVKLLDQSLVAGVGNIYASEALYRAGISPRARACLIPQKQVQQLWLAIRETLAEAINFGSTVPLDHAGEGARDGLFYFGSAPEYSGFHAERLRVYDRRDQPCSRCGARIKRIVQSARSTFYCPSCQRQ
jgi:formamidopyrimidine-DNA glycosylase